MNRVCKRLTIILVFLLFVPFGDLKHLVVSSDSADAVTSIIQIKPDGAVEGTVKIERNGDTYTFTADIDVYLSDYLGSIKGCLLVEKDNVIIDGAGHTLRGNGTGVGIFLRSMHNITIKNLKIEGFAVGVSSYTIDDTHTDFRRPTYRSAFNIKLIGNEIATVDAADDILSGYLSGWGVYLMFAEKTVISGNTIKAQDPTMGLYVGDCNDTLIVDNKFVGCGLHLSSLGQNTLVNNVVDGKPVVFLKGASESVVDCAEQVFLYNCTRISVSNVNPNANYHGTVQLEETSNSIITNCSGNIVLTRANNNTIRDGSPYTIVLKESSGNKISSNNITESGQCLKISGSSNYNEIYRNRILNSRNSSEAKSLFNAGQNTLGIQLSESQGNKIYGNSVVNHILGIDCDEISNTTIYDNVISDCNSAITLYSSEGTSIFQNNITASGTAVSIRGGGADNAFFHNNFCNNDRNAYEEHKSFMETMYGLDYPDIYSQNNTWDAEYPAGGNYWSDYNGTDKDADGIGDTSYEVSPDYVDHYPLMEPFPVPDYFEVAEEDNETTPYEQDTTDPEETPPPNEEPATPNLTVIAAASAVAVVSVGVGSLLYFKRRKRHN